MPTPLQDYLARLSKEYNTGVTTEHSLRPALVELLASLPALRHFRVINEPKRIACGAPDIVLLNKENSPVAYIETKDIGDPDLHGVKQNKEQFDRYRQGLDLVVFTDFLRFLLYQAGECVLEVQVAKQDGDRLSLFSDAEVRFDELVAHLRDAQPVPLTSPKRLALLMAGKAQLLARAIHTVLSDAKSDAGKDLHLQLERMKRVLMSEVSPAEFADWYAQTLVYGLFAARYHDEHLDTFSREEAAKLIPQSNPFLRKLFQQIGVYDLDERIAWIIDDLVTVFGATDVHSLLDSNRDVRDPVMLFYEDFLTAYNPERRKTRGVYYTPTPVVSFIVRAVDDLLQKTFGVKDGLADDSLTLDGQHRLQILDPATGTGTFLVEVVRTIYSKFAGQTGVWNNYVREHLLPRLHGYELLMAPYAMAHLNLEHVFHQTGATDLGDARYGIYLTNTLEAQHPYTDALQGLFPIDKEAEAANALKRDMRVMVMLGNPPYSRGSKNKSEWIEGLMQSYKTDLNEQNIQPLSDDYIKFIRYAQWQIERTGEGVVAFITNNSFLDGVVYRRMREELLRVFDEIYILNLHGERRLGARNAAEEKDENLFNIQVGASINIFVRRQGGAASLSRFFYKELWGARKTKLETLSQCSLAPSTWQELTPAPPSYFFTPKVFIGKETYMLGFSLADLFISLGMGVYTKRDSVVVRWENGAAAQLLDDAASLGEAEFRERYQTGEDRRDWTVANALADVAKFGKDAVVAKYLYRPYDVRYVPYTGYTRGLFAFPSYKTFGVLLHPACYALCITKAVHAASYQHCFVVNGLADKTLLSTRDVAYLLPLYRLPNTKAYTPAELAAGKTRVGEPVPLELNMRPEVLDKISAFVGTTVAGKEVFDYVYGVLHDPEYRTRYFEFLKIDYPRIPYPKDKAEFLALVAKGAWLRRLHLMDESLELPRVASFEVAGSNEVTRVCFEETPAEAEQTSEGRVWINDTQYFAHVPRRVWDHYVGAYQPVRLWLQKRVGRTLDFDDVRWYLRLCATVETEIAPLQPNGGGAACNALVAKRRTVESVQTPCGVRLPLR